ncbi:MAG: cytochrome c biogenesis protein ResB [Actinomycetota bacterium]|nr:cytochrome c biogenesis protein ResB [Actinomycetota bacterium]
MTVVEALSTAPEPVAPLPRGAGPIALARRWWRALTSMRTALVLLFLLAVAAVPGSLLPQRSLSQSNVAAYFAEHPDLAPWLDRLRLFDVFSSPWFAAIYLLLFVSLLGCIVPRTRQHWRVVRQPPPSVPARLDRLTLSQDTAVDVPTPEAADVAVATLRAQRWRVVRRDAAGVVEISAEKGYLREVGNLVFHGALVVLLAGLAYGRLSGYEGSILVEEGSGFCNSFQQYDTYRNGPLAGAGDLAPLCADLDAFSTEYADNFTPTRFRADLTYTRELGGPAATYPLEVNSPLRTDGVRLYLTGHGYSPRFTITYPDGSQFTDLSAPFLPEDPTTLASTGTLKLPDRPGEGVGEDDQLAIEGFFVPTAADLGDNRLVSVDPRPLNPAVAIVVYQGSLGLDSGAPQNVFRLDQTQIERGVLAEVASGNLFAGQSLTLPDGTEIRFEGYRQWAALQLSHDPGQLVVLGAAVAALIGLLGSLVVRRRRIWVRCVPAPADGPQAASRTVVQVGGLARSDNPGFAAQFQELVDAITGPVARED